MKVIESEKPDRAGHYPIFFPKTATVSQIYDWLWHRFGGEGYKFVIVIDVSHDEYFGGDGVIRPVEDVIAWMRLPEPFQEDSV